MKLDRKNIQDILALTPMQEGMLFHYLKDPNGDHYFEQLSLEVTGKIHVQLFEKAWNVVIETNEMLRTIFRWEKLGNPSQIILKKYQLRPKYYDLSANKSSQKKNGLGKIKDEDRKEKFDLREVPFRVTLCKLEENKYEMIISNHHILYDGWSNGIILKEFFYAYHDLYHGKKPVKPHKTRFKEFIKWIRNRDLAREKKYWKDYLKGFENQTRLSIKVRKAGVRINPGTYQISFEKDIKINLDGFVKKRKLTLASFLYTAWGILLQKYNNTDDVIFGTTVAGRVAKVQGINRIVGLFINTIPLRIQTLSDEKTGHLLERIHNQLRMREEFVTTPLVNIKEYMKIHNKEELFDSIMVIENYPLDSRVIPENSKLSVDSHSMVETTHYDLTIAIEIFDDIRLIFTYNIEAFNEPAMVRMANHFRCIVERIIENPGREAVDIEIISEEEKNEILYEFNNTGAEYPRDKAIHLLFAEQVNLLPDNIAVIAHGAGDSPRFIAGGVRPIGADSRKQPIHITYKELNEKSNQLAYLLREKGAAPDTIVGIMVGRSTEMIIGIFGILKAGGAYLPVDPGYPQERINYILADSSAKVLLVSPETQVKVKAEGEENLGQPQGLPLQFINIETYLASSSKVSPLTSTLTSTCQVSPANLAYVIYTSGTTGRPKGVLVQHGNSVNLVFGLQRNIYRQYQGHLKVVLVAPYGFDASVKQIFTVLLLGHMLCIVPEEIRIQGDALMEYYRKYCIDISDGTPTHLRLLIGSDEIEDQRQGQPVFIGVSLKHFIIGGEALPQPAVEVFLDHFEAPTPKIANVYGPTECCVDSTWYEISKESIGEVHSHTIPIGKPMPNVQIYIVNHQEQLQPIGVPGQLLIGGDGVGRGYLNQPELTAEKFARVTNERLYRTGDLAKRQPDGSVLFLGRIDHQVKIRGFRIEPGEIENQLLNYHQIKEVVVITKDDENGDKYLCAYIVPHCSDTFEILHLRTYLAEKLPDSMVPAFFVELSEIPVTLTGKVDRKALPEPGITSAKEYITPRNEEEEVLVAIWSDVLGIRKEKIGIDDNFFQLGGHSLKATILAGRIHKAFDIKISLAVLFESPTIRGLHQHMTEIEKRLYQSISLVEKKEYYPLSSPQKRLFLIYQMDLSSITYNVTGIRELEGKLEKERLEECFRRLIQRHESLRTSFELIDGEPVQKIHPQVELEIELYQVKVKVEETINNFVRPFDLSKALLLRVGLIHLHTSPFEPPRTGTLNSQEGNPGEKHLLLLDMHHIISDGVSMEIFIKEFTALYRGEQSLPDLHWQYKDFSLWQNNLLTTTAIKKQEAYWLHQFAGDVPVLQLPLDYPRPSLQQFVGNQVSFDLGEEKTRELNRFVRENQGTLFTVLLAVFSLLLSKLSGQEDIVVGTPTAGRNHHDQENIIGMFVNTLTLRFHTSGPRTLTEFIRETRKNFLVALENQDYPYENLVDRVVVNRDLSRNPLFDAVFVMQNTGMEPVELPGLRLIPYEYQVRTSKFDLTLIGGEIPGNLRFTFEYSTNLFKESTLRRYISYFNQLLSGILTDKDRNLSGIEIIPENERQQILYDFNDTEAQYPKDKVIHRLFEEQVERTPDYTALVGPTLQITNYKQDEEMRFIQPFFSITYRELNKKSNQLARRLIERGVTNGSIVCIVVERSLEMIMAILAALKAGCAYLPIELSNPSERIKYILYDSHARALVTQPGPVALIEFDGEVINTADEGIYWAEDSNLSNLNSPTDVCYIIYTSGTTGNPKGMMIQHQNVVQLMFHDRFLFDFDSSDVWTMFHSYCFDFSVWEMYGALLFGAQLVVVAKMAARDTRQYLQLLKKHRVTVLNQTPSAFYPLIEEELSHDAQERALHLKYVIFGGEALSPAKLKEWRKVYPRTQLINMYGITETTVHVTFKEITEKDMQINRSNIGKPLPTLKAYVLDRYLKLQPLGVPGELCVGGAGLGRGYLNRPGLTGEKFAGNPYKPAERLYRSGDLVRLLENGEMEYLGRIDHQVKIRGFRIELGEIENRLLDHQHVKEAVVIAGEGEGGDKYLCAYVVPCTLYILQVSELRQYLAEELPDYMVPSYYVFLEKITLTSSGKVDRKALPPPEINVEGEYVAPRNELEEKIAEIWAEVLGVKKQIIGIDFDFFALGGHSLKAIDLVSKIYRLVYVKLPLVEMFKHPTIRRLSQYISETVEERYWSIEATEKKEYYVLSSAQKRLYFLYQMDETTIVYNIPSVMSLNGRVDRNKLEKTFAKLIQRHESLRTSFKMIEEEPAQRIHDQVEFKIEYYDLTTRNRNRNRGQITGRKNDTHLWSEFIRPFNLSQAPLLRVGLVKLHKNSHLLMVDIHHIISDGLSMEIVIKEFTTIYVNPGKELPALNIQYKDYSEWQHEGKQKQAIRQQSIYWLKEFTGEIPVLRLPTDFDRKVLQSFAGSTVTFDLGCEYTDKLRVVAREQGATLYMVLFSLYNVLLSKISGQEDIVVGTPTAGRRHSDLGGIIGMFVNTLPLRNYPKTEKTFKESLKDVKKRTWEALENQDYPFEELVEQVEVIRDSSRNPIFDVMFVWQNLDPRQLQTLQIPDLELKKYDHETGKSKFDMTLTGTENENNIYFTITYNTDLFTKTTIRRFVEYFKRIAAAVIDSPVKKLMEIDILADEEKKRLLYDFNATTAEYPAEKTIRLLFEEQVEKTPDHVALIGQIPHRDVSITYIELNRKANQLARRLKQKGTKPDAIIGIMIEPSLEMIIGIQAILKAGGGYLPIDPLQPTERIIYMLKDSRAAVLLTTPRLTQTLTLTANDLLKSQCPLFYFDDPSISLYGNDGTNLENISRSQDVVYTIYTSGTTGKSKGTLLENKNLVNYINWFKKKVQLVGNDRTVLNSSFAFDLGYTIIFSSILSGCQLHMIPRDTYLSPENFIDYIQRHRLTYIKVTPSLFSTLVKSFKFSKQTCQSLRLVLLGGEEIKPLDVEKVHAIGGHMEFMNHYGPTEATIGCVARFIDFHQFDQYKKHPTIGSPIDNMKAAILDNGLMLVPVGVAGELCVSGAGVARGYLNQPELTAEKFRRVVINHLSLVIRNYKRTINGHSSLVISSPDKLSEATNDRSNKFFPNDQCPMTNDRFYKTGDLARWLLNGNIEFLGRIDLQVKIRGYRIELEDIQNQLLSHKKVKEAVVIIREHMSGDKYLCAYIVKKHMPDEFNPSEFNQYLADKLPDYMLPSYFVTVDRIPLTPNGKLNRKLLPVPEVKVETEPVAPGDAVEEKLLEIWADLLSPGGQHPSIGINDDFFYWGGHSLKAIILISRIHKVFHVNIPLAEIFKTPTIRGLAAYIKSRKQVRYTAVESVEVKDYYSLSSAQKRLHILHQMDEASTGYNMPSVMVLYGEIDQIKLEEVFLKLIHRHESLRTSFEIVEEEPVQRIHNQVEFKIEYYDISEVEVKAKSRESEKLHHPSLIIDHSFVRPFDLRRAPLLRVGLINLPHTPTALRGHPSQEGKEDKYLLMVDMHHIISDGISRRLLIKEFMTLIEGKELPALPLQYKDFSQWQTGILQKETLKSQERYWKRQLAGELPVLDLPTDYARPAFQRFEGSCITFELDQEETRALNALALERSTTLYMVLLAIYYIFLSKLTNQEDIIIGTPTAGRLHADLEPIIGMFVNTLALRNYPLGEKTYTEFLNQVKERSLEAFENQDYQYEILVEEISVPRDASRNPLFDTMFVMQNMGIPSLEIPGLSLAPYEHPSETSKFDLTLTAAEVEEKLVLSIQYSTNLFKRAAIGRFITYFKMIVMAVLENPGIKIYETDILSREEKRRLLVDFNDTHADYPRDKTLHQLFEEQAAKAPGHIAIIGPMPGVGTGLIASDPGKQNVHLTYNQLNKGSDQLARQLRAKSVKPETVVSIMMERSTAMIIGILGILKAGGAYLPIDPSYPGERIRYMLIDSGSKILVTTKDLSKEIEFAIDIIYLSDEINPVPTHPHLRLSPTPATCLAYVIYTSGSTGKPKGVLVEHTSVVNLIYSQENQFKINKRDRILQFSTICFDASVEQIFIALLNGAMLVLIDKDILLETSQFDAYISRCGITHIHAVPSFLTHMALTNTSSLKRVLSGGDVCPVELARKWSQYCSFYNRYGPTETTVTSIEILLKTVDEGLPRLPIGRPINNTFIYLLDRWLNLVPPAVVGELYIGGAGVARGYLNRPGLTLERFIRIEVKEEEVPSGQPMQSCIHASMQYHSPSQYPIPPLPHSPIYRTGDLARWLPDGNIEFIGRIDLQVKVRGYRIELAEIENQLLRYEGIKDAVVMAWEKVRDKYLAAYIVLKTGGDISMSGLREYLSGVLPDYMIPSYFVEIEKVPLSASGKIDRRTLPEPELKIGQIYTAPRDEIEQKLADIWAEVLSWKTPIGIDNNFFTLGGHSLKAMILAARVHKVFDVKLPLNEIFKKPFIRPLAEFIKSTAREHYTPINAAETKEYYSLSSAQKRLYFLHQMEETSTAYNMPTVLELTGSVSLEHLENTFMKLVQRHESLRTSFSMVKEEPVQHIHDEVEFEIEYYVAAGGTRNTENRRQTTDDRRKNKGGRSGTHLSSVIHHLSSRFIRPFDLSRVPLLRVGLIRVEKEKNILMKDMHHIISDGISISVLVKEFVALYQGEELLSPRLQYKDFAAWQNSQKEKTFPGAQEKYWLKTFADGIPVLTLPTDYGRPAIQKFEGAVLHFEINRQEKDALNTLAMKEGATLYMVLLALYYIFLSRLSGQEEIVVGTPVAGRRYTDLEQMIGVFINTLPLKNDPSGTKSIREFIKETKEKTLQAFANQDYPYEEMVERLEVERDTCRNPLFNVMFVFQNIDSIELQIPGLKLTPYHCETKTSKFDLLLAGMEKDHRMSLTLEYSTNLFKETTIRRFITYFKTMVSSMLKDSLLKLGEIDILPTAEKREILYDFNDTAIAYPEEKTVYELFAEQTARTPDNTAVKGTVPGAGGTSLSFRALNDRANLLAQLLRVRGITTNVPVGIMMERSLDMVIGILAIIKAGGIYLPVDPQYPENRIALIAKTSGMNLLLSVGQIMETKLYSLPSLSHQLDILLVDKPGTTVQEQSLENPEIVNRPGDLIYIIFTSGSTGIPKGAGVYHHGFTNLMNWFVTEFELKNRDRNLLLTSLSFDLTQKNLYASLVTGGMLCIPQVNYFEPSILLRHIWKEGITWINCTPGMFYKLVEYGKYEEAGKAIQFATLRYVFLGGEPITITHLLPWLESDTCHAEVVNTYGPTECTDICASYRIRQPRRFLQETIPVGQPVYNVQLYIVDKHLQVVPVGVVGELLIGGAGVGIGYINDKYLTSEKFMRHTFDTNEPEQLFYHTGDLVKWRPDGNIEFVGRMDHQVKVRGFRVEIGEIESQLLSHQQVKEAVVVPREGEGRDHYLCAYIVPHHLESFQEEEIKNYLSEELPHYMLPSYFMMLEKIPLNPHGKVDRKALPEPALKAGKDYVPPGNKIEIILVRLWSDMLNLDKDAIGVHDNFFQLGGHSLKATVLISKLHEEFQVKVRLANVFQTPTISGLAQRIREMKPGEYISISPGEEKEFYPASYSQKRFWLLDQNTPGAATFNMAGIITLDHHIDAHLVKKVLNRIIQRHDSFRTGFQVIEDQLVQVIKKEIHIPLKIVDLSSPEQPGKENKKQEIYSQQLAAPFDLKQMPLFRTALLKFAEEKYELLFNMHHIISDGWSLEILKQEFKTLYDASKRGTPCDMQPLGIRYKDYVTWQNHLLANKEKMAEAQEFWKSYLGGTMPVLNLPYDFTYFSSSTASSAFRWVVSESLTNRLRKMAADHHASLFMVLLAGFNILLSRVTGQKDIILATPAAARQHDALKNIVGLFVNTLILRNQINAEESFIDFFEHFQDHTFKVLDYQGIPLELIFSQLKIKYPAISAFFNMLNIGGTHQQTLAHLESRHMEKVQDTKFELVCYLSEYQNGIEIQCHYFRNRFKPLSIEKLMDLYKKTLDEICKEPGKKLEEYRFINKKKKLKRHN